MLGSTANYVVHHATTPVVVVRGDEPVSPPRRVVVGVDDDVGMDDTDDGAAGEVDSPSLRALRWAVDLPGVEHVTALHAWFLPPIAVGMFTPNVELAAMDQAAKRVAQRAAAAIGPVRDGVTLEAVSGRGSADFAMREASRDADLVVVGSRGRGGFSELLLGSTIAPLLAHSHAPVAVIR